jgi:predicted transcriptional regulator
MVTRPVAHPPWTTIRELRAFLADEHVHMALLVDGEELVGTVEAADLVTDLGDRAPAREVAVLDGRTVEPELDLADALEWMTTVDRRRLAVVTGDSRLVGLLCLKSSGRGFCSDEDVSARHRDRLRVRTSERPPPSGRDRRSCSTSR